MRFPLLAILSIVPLLNLAQASRFDSPLDAREYIDGLTTREFDDAADLQLRADILAGLSTRTIGEEIQKRLFSKKKEKKTEPAAEGFYKCDNCNRVVKKPGPGVPCAPNHFHEYKWLQGTPEDHKLRYSL
ncbi:hypothetical protein DFP72DRAFT_935469 [Ephemerocybe angulata]|uniref:Uncharacterized protein n=1 Tax=Ephemerocybe angulata TaxID=980116 RepID=A0A8H6HC79_9AGAR|nr:hypothetical protein DFP72DRAFT_935469 [Tulosesus angulatus]